MNHPILRDYQQEGENNIISAWENGNDNVIAVYPTGSGKSVLVSSIVRNHQGACVVIAHRQELVTQMSMHLARDGIYHRVVASRSVINTIIKLQYETFKMVFIDPDSDVAVAGVQTLIRRGKELKAFLPRVSLWVIDECHHLLAKNVWGTAVKMFTRPGVKGLGVTATPTRTDGKGLGRSTDGLMDKLIVGTDMRSLINQGYLSDYRIFAPVNNLSLEDVKISKNTGEYNDKDLSEAVKKSTLVVHKKSTMVGDVVQSYLKFDKGKLGITFVPSMDIGRLITEQFNSVGIPAELINAKTPDDVRAGITKRFAKRELLQLVNIEIFSEGFDLPSLEVVSMARPTQSYGMFSQQFGRALRIMDGKDKAIIIDHVGNVGRHGLPDAPREWSLERKTKREKADDDSTPVKTCPKCMSVYERFRTECPYCKHKPIPADRENIQQVDGDLTELTPETLAEMRGTIDTVNSDVEEQITQYRQELLNNYCKPAHIRAHCNRKTKALIHQQESQTKLRDRMSQYGGYHRYEGRSNEEIFKLFYLTFNVDWLNAQALSGEKADALTKKIEINIDFYFKHLTMV